MAEESNLENQVIVFTTHDQKISFDVNVDKETVWLTQDQMAKLFEKERSVITKHIRNIYLEKELEKLPTCANFAQVQKEGARLINRNKEHYNLDVIISVGYRVKSQRGIQFRQWATKILKEYLIKGYSINQRRFDELEKQVKTMNLKQREIIEAIRFLLAEKNIFLMPKPK